MTPVNKKSATILPNNSSKSDLKKYLLMISIVLFVVLVSFVSYNLGLQNTNDKIIKTSYEQIMDDVQELSDTKTESYGFYSVEYPSDFFIASKYAGDLLFMKEEWRTSHENNPTVGVRTYSGDIPTTMSLRGWLSKVGSTKPWNEYGNSGIPCRDSKEELRKENSKGYGGSDQKLDGDMCIYFSVKDIRSIDLQNVKDSSSGYPDLEIIEFTSSDSGSLGNIGTHTLISTGTGAVYEIYMNTTTYITENNDIERAYELLKSSFNFIPFQK